MSSFHSPIGNYNSLVLYCTDPSWYTFALHGISTIRTLLTFGRAVWLKMKILTRIFILLLLPCITYTQVEDQYNPCKDNFQVANFLNSFDGDFVVIGHHSTTPVYRMNGKCIWWQWYKASFFVTIFKAKKVGAYLPGKGFSGNYNVRC